MPGRVQFGVYELDLEALELRKHGLPIRLQDQPLQILAALIERRGEIVTREELQQRIWGNDTFVDFDQSLNKAVNRLREALNDDPAQPRYVETVPRRGYRFIAPVNTGLALNGHGIPGQASSEKNLRWLTRPRIAALSVTAACIVAIAAVLLSSRGSTARIPREPRHMSSFGFTPALSSDGRLLAYAASPDGGLPHIWVQQVAGGEATQLTNGPDFEVAPDFSPDGTHIVFYSERNGGGIYVAPSLPGSSRLVVAGHDLAGPRFSPSGHDILYLKDFGIFTVTLDGGDPVPLPINTEFRVYAPPFWSPDGNEILFCGARKDDQTQAGTWWIASAKEPRVRPADLPEVGKNFSPLESVRAWIRLADGRDWIIYSTSTTDAWKLWKLPVSSQRVVTQERVLLGSGTGRLGTGAAASLDGKLTWGIWHFNHSIYQISMSKRGQRLGPTLQLPLALGGSQRSPSLSHDGKWMAYNSAEAAKPNAVVLRNLISGTNQVLDEKGRDSLVGGDVSISPDGSKVVFTRDCENGSWQYDPSVPYPCSFLLALDNDVPAPVCSRCEPRGFAPDGSSVLVQKYPGTDIHKFRIDSINLRTKAEKEFLSDPENPLFHAFISWDGRWVVFKKLWLQLPGQPGQIFIAPVRQGVTGPKSEWIAITDGKSGDDKPQFSPDGNTIYFTSRRDGYLCIWAQRLNPMTKHTVGAPFAFEHFHNAAGRAASAFQTTMYDLSVAKDKVVINLPQLQSDIWITDIN